MKTNLAYKEKVVLGTNLKPIFDFTFYYLFDENIYEISCCLIPYSLILQVETVPEQTFSEIHKENLLYNLKEGDLENHLRIIAKNEDKNLECNLKTATTAVMTNTTISDMQQRSQEFQHSLMGSSFLLSPPQKITGKSRERRMTNKPAKPGTKSFKCTYSSCDRIFKRSEHLKRHIRSIHTLEDLNDVSFFKETTYYC